MPPDTAGSAGQDRITSSAADLTQRERNAHAIFGGIDSWEVRLVIRTDKDSITDERMREVLPALIQGGIVIDVIVEELTRHAT